MSQECGDKISVSRRIPIRLGLPRILFGRDESFGRFSAGLGTEPFIAGRTSESVFNPNQRPKNAANLGRQTR